MKRIGLVLLSITCLLATSCSDKEDLTLLPITDGSISLNDAFASLTFSKPLDLQSPQDGSNRIFVAEKDGIIKSVDNIDGSDVVSTFLDVSNKTATANELGLLGFAFHPDYSTNGFLYVTYTPSETLAVISRFKVSETNANMVDESSETILLEIDQPNTNHNGGQLAFGPDGYLYIASGDGGVAGDAAGNAQNLNTLLGKILRIDVNNQDAGLNYAIPADNPFVENTNARGEIYAYGLRNPWRFSFDAQTNTIWAADVGQDELEEIDLIVKGGNYGWNILEGSSCYLETECDATDLIAPLYEYGHSKNDKSVTGGYVYRGNKLPNLKGYYIYGDFISGRVWALNQTGDNKLLLETGLSISSFGIDENNELYLCSFDGKIYELTSVG
tara:strand:+ start:32124 stop:33281 length:1158 start_codon:yes stop_codon:yes gene_type:complete